MIIKPLNRVIAKTFGQVPLRMIFIVPFVVEIFGVVGLVGYVSLRNGQQAVNEVATQLRGEVTTRVQQYLQNYLDVPHTINQLNEDAINLGLLNLDDFSQMERYFWYQLQRFETASYVCFGGQDGTFIGDERLGDGRFSVEVKDETTGADKLAYELDDRGFRTDNQIGVSENYLPAKRPWYQAAVAADRPTWSKIYQFSSDAAVRLGITAVRPYYDENGTFLGVLGTDIVLAQLGDFLSTLKVGKTGQILILERDGKLVASSTLDQPFTVVEGEALRIDAANSDDPLISSTVQNLGNLTTISDRRQLEYKLKGDRQFVQVLPFTDGRGIDWLIVVVVPEADFMEKIHANTRTTILVCVVALLVTTGLGIATARWIALPIMRLSSASRDLATRIQSFQNSAGGQLYEKVEVKGVDELGVLAESFNLMAEQLQESFEALERTNIELEERVARRTAALSRSEEKFSVAFHASPDAISITNLNDGKFIDVNDTFLTLTGYSREEVIGKKARNLPIWANLADRDRLMKFLGKEGKVRHQEYEFKIKSGEILIGLLSAQIIELNQRSIMLLIVHDITERKQAEKALRLAKEEAEYARKQSDHLLLNILPSPIADRLKKGEGSIAERFEKATVLFADIVGFTPLSAKMSPLELVCLLNQVFSDFDRLTEKHGLEKIKTLGDAYMVVGGLPVPRADCAIAIANMALDMQEAIANFKADLNPEESEQFKIRIGINTGPVVAGVIGTKKFIYDLWGDTVNVASRMESSGYAGKIQVSAASYELLKNQFSLESRGEINVKGKGKMMTYWLTGR